MKLRNGYLLAGVAWALFLAPVVTYFVLASVLGALWLFVFGDDPWPAAIDWVIPIIGLVVCISTATCCIYLAHRLGRQREIEAVVAGPQERKRVILWFLAPMALIAITAVLFWQRSVNQAEEIAAMDQSEAVFTDLLNTRHTIAELFVYRTDSGDFEASVATSGGRPGRYSLLWKVISMTYGEVISREEPQVEVGDTNAGLSFEISIDALARRYRDTVLNGGGVVVDEPFELVVTLQPVIEADIEAWPEFERYRWEQGETPLQSSMAVDFPVFFRLGLDGSID